MPQHDPTMEHMPDNGEKIDVFAELERSVYAALETYSNVHRGSGHYSMVSTRLYEEARNIVLDHLEGRRYTRRIYLRNAIGTYPARTSAFPLV
jgi:hypothetical protein